METIYLHSGKPLVLRELTKNLYGYMAIECVELKSEPLLRLRSGKMSLVLWRTIASFFRKITNDEKAEAQVRLFYNEETKVWKAHAFPQEKDTGMTTKELCDHEDFQTQMNEMLADGSHQWGTIHSHCNTGAFQSATDSTDEQSSPGIHITMGKINDAKIDLHSRFTVVLPGSLDYDDEGKETVTPAKTFQLKPDLKDFVELPTSFVSESAPQEIRSFAFDFLLTLNSEELVDKELIEKWVKNRIPKPVKTYGVPYEQRHPYHGHLPGWPGHQHHGNQHRHNGTPYWSKGAEVTGSKKNRKKKEPFSTGASSLVKPVSQKAIEPVVDQVCQRCKITQAQLLDILWKREDTLTPNEIGIILDVNSNVTTAFNISEQVLALNLEDWMDKRQKQQLLLTEGKDISELGNWMD